MLRDRFDNHELKSFWEQSQFKTGDKAMEKVQSNIVNTIENQGKKDKKTAFNKFQSESSFTTDSHLYGSVGVSMDPEV